MKRRKSTLNKRTHEKVGWCERAKTLSLKWKMMLNAMPFVALATHSV